MVTLNDPENPMMSSGLPTSLLAALRKIVGEAVGLSDAPARRTRLAAMLTGALTTTRPADLASSKLARARLSNSAMASERIAVARARTARRRLAEHPTIEGFVQVGGDYPGPEGLPMVTYQDATVMQAVRAYPWPHLRGLTERDIQSLARRQRAAYQSAVACCVRSHWVADSIVEDYGIERSKVYVVGLGGNHEIAIDPGGRDWSVPRFLFVGMDWERKNGDRVLQAFARVREQVPSAELHVAGAHPRLEMPGVTGHGQLAMDRTADRERLAGLFRRATAYVMPSLHEPLGIVHVEASNAGIASIGTSNGGASTCIGDAGYVVDPTNSREICEAMLALCDPQVAQELGARARERAELFTWDKVAERLIRAFGFPDIDQSTLAEFL
jgi:Glycosyl transferases group 1